MIVAGRRRMLTLGGSALAGLMVSGFAPKAQAATTYTDNDILNFALNLEYLEANFYYLSAFGCTIDKPNAAAIAAGAPSAGIPITISGGVGTAGTVTYTGGGQVPFGTNIAVGSYAVETAIEEGKHVLALQAALGSLAVNQPAINLATTGAGAAWPTLATAAGVTGGATFSPYASPTAFLVGAYVFEDVGVTAYHGAASLLTGTTTTLPVAAGILAVEAYHAGLVRTSITYADPANAAGFLTITGQISTLRAALAAKAVTAATTYDQNPDDYGLAQANVTLAGGSPVAATRISDVDFNTSDPAPTVAFARNTAQVLNIVTGGGAVSSGGNAVSPATGVFFPAGLNGLFK